MAITTRQVDNYIGVVELQGEFEGEAAEKIDQAISTVIGHGYRWILVNCEKLEFLDLTCAQALVSNLARLQLADGNLYLCSLSQALFALFKERYELNVAVALSEEKAREHCPRPGGDYKPIPAQKMWLWTRQSNEFTVVELLGSLYDEADILLLDKELIGARMAILECSRLVSLSTAGLGSLVGHARRLGESGGGLRVVNPAGAALYFLGLAGPTFPPFESLEAAAASF